jgi:hypothetical protein
MKERKKEKKADLHSNKLFRFSVGSTYISAADSATIFR